MSNYIVSARKYRPASFATVVGQQALTHTLKTAIASGRLAHAYLFCGPRGVGKTTCARIFAKTINCEHPTADGEACNECASCRAFNEQSSFNIIELDGASNNGVDAIRDLIDQVRIPPQGGRYKVYIIDEVHMLSPAAFNAFLKTLEEPPEYAIFILATTEKQKVIPTILSRCQIYDFARITVPDIVQQLQYICQEEGVTAEPAALNVIAQKADGAMRDALSIFDQVAASSEGNITYQSTIDNLNVLDYDYYFRLIEAFLATDVPQSLLIYKEVRDKGFDSLFFVNGLAQHIRDLMVASSPQTTVLLEMNQEVAQRYVMQAAKLGPRFYYRALDLCNTCDLNYRNASSKQLLVELTLIKLCQIAAPQDPGSPGSPPQSPLKGGKPSAAAVGPAGPPSVPPEGGKPSAAAVGPAGPPSVPPEGGRPSAVAVGPAGPPSVPPEGGRPSAAAVGPAGPPSVTPVGGKPSAAAVGPAGPPSVPPEGGRPSAAAATPATAPGTTASPPLQGGFRGAYRPVTQRKLAQTTPVAAEPVAQAQPTAVRREPFTAQQLHEAWQSYINANPHEMLTISSMRTAQLEPMSDTVYAVYVESKAQVESIESSKSKIMPHLRNAVKNDMLALELKVRPSTVEHRILTPREVVEDIKQRRPDFIPFIKEFQLGLA